MAILHRFLQLVCPKPDNKAKRRRLPRRQRSGFSAGFECLEERIARSCAGSTFIDGLQFGGCPGDIPIAADFDGDGQADLAIRRPQDGSWHVRTSSSDFAQELDKPFTVWGSQVYRHPCHRRL